MMAPTSQIEVGTAVDQRATARRAIRIVHVFSNFGAGGQQARTCTLLNAFGDEFQHTLISTDGDCRSTARLSPTTRFQVVPPPPGKGSASYPVALARAIRPLNPDLLLTYNWGAFDAVMASVLFRICPVIHIEDGFGKDE